MTPIHKSLFVALGVTLLSASAMAETLTVVSWGGAYSKSQRKAYHEPFMKETGHTVREDEWSGEVAVVRALVETGNYKWDVLNFATGTVIQACDEGLLERIDTEKLGLTGDDFLEGGFLECGMGTIIWATVLSHRTDVYPAGSGPKNWADFFDTTKFPGRRGIAKWGAHNLPIALMADGVPPDKVWETLGTPAGVDRGFAKLDTIKSDLIIWETGAMAPQLLADKEVVMTSAWNGRIYNAVVDDNQPFHIVWDGQIYDFGYFAIPAGNPRMDLAYEFLKFAGRPDRQGDQSNYIAYGNARMGADKYVNPDILPHLPTYSPNLENALRADAIFLADHGGDLDERWQNWLAK